MNKIKTQEIPENVMVLTQDSWYVILEPNLDEFSQMRIFISESDNQT
jgi:hypothetical protein